MPIYRYVHKCLHIPSFLRFNVINSSHASFTRFPTLTIKLLFFFLGKPTIKLFLLLPDNILEILPLLLLQIEHLTLNLQLYALSTKESKIHPLLPHSTGPATLKASSPHISKKTSRWTSIFLSHLKSTNDTIIFTFVHNIINIWLWITQKCPHYPTLCYPNH